jgi:hypothetical protein
MSDGGWWARRLGMAPPARQETRPAAPTGLPRKAVRWEDSYPPTSPQQRQLPPDQSEGDEVYIRVRQQGFNSKAPAGSAASGRCPECGGGNFFRRRWANAEAAPLCVDCGYNGEYFTQTGTMLSNAGVISSGPTQSARSDNPHAASRFGMDDTLSASNWNPAALR